ncbi:MAG: hypothetical protein Q9183_006794, partial [Haloplaca sp. 2 TL-2023]
MVCCDFSLYDYAPSKVAPIIFLVVFLVSTIHHVYLNAYYKSWKITATLPWGGTLFVAGFIMREISAFKTHHLPIFIASTVLLLVAPPVYALTNYIILGRVLYYVPYLSPINPGRVVSTFVAIDVVVGILSANGGARIIQTNSTDSVEAGQSMLRASILLQVIAFFLFVLL